MPPSGIGELSRLLRELNARGRFPISVLTDYSGLTIASAAASGQDPDVQAAVVALVQQTAAHVREQLRMAQTDEVTIHDAEGRTLVCRPAHVSGHDMILAVFVPARDMSYRRLMNRAVEAMRRLWNN